MEVQVRFSIVWYPTLSTSVANWLHRRDAKSRCPARYCRSCRCPWSNRSQYRITSHDRSVHLYLMNISALFFFFFYQESRLHNAPVVVIDPESQEADHWYVYRHLCLMRAEIIRYVSADHQARDIDLVMLASSSILIKPLSLTSIRSDQSVNLFHSLCRHPTKHSCFSSAWRSNAWALNISNPPHALPSSEYYWLLQISSQASTYLRCAKTNRGRPFLNWKLSQWWAKWMLLCIWPSQVRKSVCI